MTVRLVCVSILLTLVPRRDGYGFLDTSKTALLLSDGSTLRR
jgi:hypothetical protein